MTSENLFSQSGLKLGLKKQKIKLYELLQAVSTQRERGQLKMDRWKKKWTAAAVQQKIFSEIMDRRLFLVLV